MKFSYRIVATVSVVFLSFFADFNETFAIECYDSESGFYHVIETYGWEDGIKSILTSINPACYEPFLIRHRDITEPILRDIVHNPDKYPVLCARRAIYFSSRFRFDNLLNEFLKLTHHPLKPIRNESKRAFAETCKADQFHELLSMLTPEEPDLNRSLLATMRERKIFDPQILERWRDDQLEKDKKREKTLMRDWFIKEVNQTIQVLKDANPRD